MGMFQALFCRQKTNLRYEYFLQFFPAWQILQIKDFEEKGMPEILKKSSKTRDRFTATSDLQNNVERVLFQAGNRQLSQKFPKEVYSPQVPNNWK